MKRTLALLLTLCAVFLLCSCGSGGTAEDDGGAAALPTPSRQSPAASGVELSFPVISAPLSEAQTEAMINHNARSCALMIEDRYYCCRAYPDGKRELGSYQVIDGGLLRYSALAEDCGAEFLCMREGRLYCLGPDGRPVSLLPDGSGRRTELEYECISLQLCSDGTLYCLSSGGELIALRPDGGRESVLSGAKWAFVSDEGVFYTAAADGRVHLLVPAAGADLCLTAEAADCVVVIGGDMLYCVREESGLRIRSLDLIGGEEKLCEAMTLDEAPDYLYDGRTGWAVRFVADSSGGRRQLLAPCDGIFDGQFSAYTVDGELRRCRYISVPLRLDELRDEGGRTTGFALALPDGSEITY